MPESRRRPRWLLPHAIVVLVRHLFTLLSLELRLLNMWKQVKQWYLVDISMAWMHWSKTRKRFPLPSVIIFWWLVCLSRARYQPNILSQSPVCTRCSINPMNWPFDWWGTAQECWEIGKVRGSGVSEWKEWEGDEGFWLQRVTFDTCLNISPLMLKHRAEPAFLGAWRTVWRVRLRRALLARALQRAWGFPGQSRLTPLDRVL